ncbi:MAG TPA: peptide ABC transporter substrate-binding protein [Chloroflexia bacterium]
MSTSRSHISRAALYVGAVIVLGLSSLPGIPSTASAQQDCRSISDIAVCGRFLEEWGKPGNERASLYINGLPITGRRPEISVTDGKLYETQWFERAKYEAHPEHQPPYDVQLGLLGSNLVEGRGWTNPRTGELRHAADRPFLRINMPADADGKKKVWFPETRHSLTGRFLEFWNRSGGLKQFGFPVSEEFDEISSANGRIYRVQYFERNRMELHPENPPDYQIELGLLGVQQYKTTPIAADQLPISPPKGVVSTKDTLVLAMSYEPDNLFPLFSNLNASAIVSRLIFNQLVAYDAKDNLYPEIAWYVPTLENGGAYFVGIGEDRHLVVKYKLRPGIKWADGKEITSNDLFFHYALIMNPDSPVEDRTLWEKLYYMDNPDKYTALFNYMSLAQARDFYNKPGQDKAHFAFLEQFIEKKRPVIDASYNMIADVLPAHILEGIPPARIAESFYGRNPIASGPFKVETWYDGSQIVLVPNPNYNLTSAPLLKKIVVKFIPDINEVVDMLKAGELDAATQDIFYSRTTLLNSLEGTDQVVEYVPGHIWERLDFNLDRAPLKEKAVRQAIAYAIDRQRLIDRVMLGKSTILHTFLPPISWASMQNPDFARQWEGQFPLRRYDYDPSRANRLLDEAGWIRGSDGIRSKGGVKLSLTYASSRNATRQTVMYLVADDLRAVGIEATPVIFPTGFFSADGGYIEQRRFDLAQYASVLGIEPGGQQFDSEYIPAEQNNRTGTNYSGYRNPNFDRLSRSAANEVDRAIQAPLLAEMQAIISEDLPTLPLYTRLNIEVHKSTLMNWETSGGLTYSTYKAAAMYFK